MTKPEDLLRWSVTVTFRDGSWETHFMTTDADETADSLMKTDFNFDLLADDSDGDRVLDEWHWITDDIRETGFCFRPCDVKSINIERVKNNG